MMIDIERRQNQFEHDQILTVKIRDLLLSVLRCIQPEDKQCHGSYAQVNEFDTGSDG
jgi:hypothetical protein